MDGAQVRREMTVDEFLAWNLEQDQRYELVDGLPVPLRAMAGAKAEHDTIVVNLIVELGRQLASKSCRPRTADTAVRTKIKGVRRPDVTIECAALEKGSLEARNPVAVFEVLSPTTRPIDRGVKLQEFLRHPSLRLVVHVDPDIMDVLIYRRADDGSWDTERIDAPDAAIRLSEPTVEIPLSIVYDGVPLVQPAAAHRAGE